MTRSKWKGPFLYKSFFKLKKINISYSGSSVIVPIFIGKLIKLYTGQFFSFIYITSSLISYKLGEFSSTRKDFFFKK